MEALLKDIQYGLRMIARKPLLTAAIVLTLGLSIGANTAIFSIANAALIDPLPFKDGDRLLRLYDVRRRDNGGVSQVSFSARNFHQVREQAQSFDGVMAQVFMNLNLSLEENPDRIVAIGVSDGWLSTLGIGPALGRGFGGEEERAGSNSRVVLISHGFWGRRLGFDPSVLGKTISLNEQTYSIIGVLPRGLSYPYNAEVWMPWTFDRNNGRAHTLNVQARLRRGVSLNQAQAELDAIAGSLASQFPDTNAGYSIRAVPLSDVLIADHDRLILILLVAVGFVLMIACANVASLLLARSAGRQKEFAIRAALGASRARQIRQLLVENILLSLLGGGLGMLLTFWARGWQMSLIPPDVNFVMEEVPLDLTVFAFTLAVSILIGALIAIVPALRLSRLDLQTTLKEGGRAGIGASGSRMLNALVVGEIALALVLLSGAGMMVQNLYLLQNADIGFDAKNLLTLRIAMNETRYAEPQARVNLIRQTLEQIKNVTSIVNVAAANFIPLQTANRTAVFAHEGRPADPNEQLVVNHRVVSPSYFETMKIPLLKGRLFTDADIADSQRVAIISQSMARRYWLDEDPVGRRVRWISGNQSITLLVVGVAGDVSEPRLSGEIRETWYIPFSQSVERDINWASMQMAFVIRTSASPTMVLAGVRTAIRKVDPTLPVFDVNTADEIYAETLTQKRISAVLLLCFSSFGFLMAALGIYGVLSYAASRRSQEIGVRLALGAQASDILRMVLKQGAIMIFAGVAIGLAGAFILTRFLSNVVSDMGANDPRILALATLILSAVALAACYIPARRASKVDPMIALRYE
ncbi:MAG: ABC transporter permease [Acidobacteriota bacterium]